MITANKIKGSIKYLCEKMSLDYKEVKGGVKISGFLKTPVTFLFEDSGFMLLKVGAEEATPATLPKGIEGFLAEYFEERC